MFEILRKFWTFVSLLFIFALLACLVFWPALAQPLGAAILVMSLGVTVLFTTQNRWQHRRAGGGNQFIRDLALDLLGLGLTLGAAMYAGQLAGAYVGLRAGFGRVCWPGSCAVSWRPGERGLHGSSWLREYNVKNVAADNKCQ